MSDNRNSWGCFYGIGTGPGDPGLLTLKAADILRRVEVIFAAAARDNKSFSGTVVSALDGCRAERRSLPFTMAKNMADREQQWRQNAAYVVRELAQGKDCAFVTIGDPLLYSTFTYLMREVEAQLAGVRIETVPGIMAFQDLAARFNLPTVEDRESLMIVPAWGRDRRFMEKLAAADTVILMKTSSDRAHLLAELKAAGFAGEIVYGARLGQEGEELRRGEAAILEGRDQYLSLMIAKRNPERRATGRRPEKAESRGGEDE